MIAAYPVVQRTVESTHTALTGVGGVSILLGVFILLGVIGVTALWLSLKR